MRLKVCEERMAVPPAAIRAGWKSARMKLKMPKPAWYIYARDEARSKVDATLKKAPNQRFRLAISMTYEEAIKRVYEGSMSDWAYLLTRAKLE